MTEAELSLGSVVLRIGGTYGQYTGSLPAESSSLDSSMNESESHTHWACQRQKERTNKLTTHQDLPNIF